MDTTQQSFNINNNEKKPHVVYLVESACCCVLRVARLERNHYCASLSITVNKMELVKKKQAHYFFKQDKMIENARPDVLSRLKI